MSVFLLCENVDALVGFEAWLDHCALTHCFAASVACIFPLLSSRFSSPLSISSAVLFLLPETFRSGPVCPDYTVCQNVELAYWFLGQL